MNDNKRLKRKVRNSYIVSTVSVMLVLFLLGSVGYLTVAAMQIASTLRESITVIAELKNDLSDEQRQKIETLLTDEELIASITYSPKEDKLADGDFRQLFGEDFVELLGENPLPDSYELRLTAQSSDRAQLDPLIGRIEKISGIAHVSYPVQMAEQLHATVNKIRLVLLLFGGALLAISLILLNNTIRLAIFSKRYLINTMKLVGATKWFIMRPFLRTSITQGVLSGLGASALFGAAVYGLNESIPELLTLAEGSKIALIVGSMVVGGVLISMIFTLAAVNKFVNMKSNKIYLY